MLRLAYTNTFKEIRYVVLFLNFTLKFHNNYRLIVDNLYKINLLELTMFGLIRFGTVCPPKARTKSKISEFDMTRCVNENVIRFYIPMNESQVMNTFNRTG